MSVYRVGFCFSRLNFIIVAFFCSVYILFGHIIFLNKVFAQTNVRFKIIWLNTIEGGFIYYPKAINNSGAVVGTYSTNDVSERPFYYYNGEMKDLLAQDAQAFGGAFSINDSFVSGGYASSGYQGNFFPVVYANDSIIYLSDHGSRSTSLKVRAINNNGDTAGGAEINYPYPYPCSSNCDNWQLAGFFKPTAGEMIGLESDHNNPPYTQIWPYDINSSGQMVGLSNNVWGAGVLPFLYENNELKTLGITYGQANSINDKGAIVGEHWVNIDGGLVNRGFLYENSQMTDLDDPNNDGSSSSAAYGINNNGWIVGGQSQDNAALLWINKQLFNLNDLAIGHGAYSNLLSATAINDKGWITGYGDHFDETGTNLYQHTPFIAIPIDTTSSLPSVVNLLLTQ